MAPDDASVLRHATVRYGGAPSSPEPDGAPLWARWKAATNSYRSQPCAEIRRDAGPAWPIRLRKNDARTCLASFASRIGACHGRFDLVSRPGLIARGSTDAPENPGGAGSHHLPGTSHGAQSRYVRRETRFGKWPGLTAIVPIENRRSLRWPKLASAKTESVQPTRTN